MTHVEESFRKHRTSPFLWFLLTLATIMSVPTWFPEIAEREGQWLPVITNVQLAGVQQDGNHLKATTVYYEKLRHCEFLRLVWLDENGRSHNLVSDPPVDLESKTYPPGRYEAGPWWIINMDKLEGSKAYAMHNCHPFWTTISEFYPTELETLYIEDAPTELAD